MAKEKEKGEEREAAAEQPTPAEGAAAASEKKAGAEVAEGMLEEDEKSPEREEGPVESIPLIGLTREEIGTMKIMLGPENRPVLRLEFANSPDEEHAVFNIPSIPEDPKDIHFAAKHAVRKAFGDYLLDKKGTFAFRETGSKQLEKTMASFVEQWKKEAPGAVKGWQKEREEDRERWQKSEEAGGQKMSSLRQWQRDYDNWYDDPNK